MSAPSGPSTALRSAVLGTLLARVAVLPLGAGWELLRLSVLREGVRRG